MFSFIKNTLGKVYAQVTSKLATLFNRTTIDQAALQELETILIGADTGVKTTRHIIEQLKQQMNNGNLAQGADMRSALEKILLQLLTQQQAPTNSTIYLLVGINGSGKTTFAGKLAYHLQQQGKRVLLVAADTFRAAAPQQLQRWAEQSGATILTGKENQEPASVVFAGCEQFKTAGFDALIIDTAGRLQTKTNLMRELEKIKKIIERQLPDKTVCTLLTIDAMLGQNSFEQAKLFHESTQLNGIVLTKMDGTGKGGIVFSITQELGIPIAYISYGEGIDQLKLFNASEYVTELLQGN